MNNKDYGQSLNDLNKELRNPALIHKIQDRLTTIEGSSVLQTAFRNIASASPGKAAAFAIQCHKENARMTEETIGKDCVEWCYEYMNEPITIKDLKITEASILPNGTVGIGYKVGDWTKDKTYDLSEEELKKLDEEDENDPDRRYHR